MSEKKRHPISIQFSEHGLSTDDRILVGDLQVTPALPIVGLELKLNVGQGTTLTLDVVPHDGWSIEAKDVLVKLRELVEVETVQDMRTSTERRDLRRIAAGIRLVIDRLAPVDAGVCEVLSGLAKQVDDVAGRL
jgi:hypothetical protein